MNIKELAKKPQLKKVTVDSEFIVKAYGEPLEFYMYDRFDIPVWMKISTLKDDQSELFNLLRELIRDETGAPVLGAGEILPIEIVQEVVKGIVNNMGNASTQTSEI